MNETFVSIQTMEADKGSDNNSRANEHAFINLNVTMNIELLKALFS